MAADCAVELRKHKVAAISLWPGAVKTEVVEGTLLTDSFKGEYYQPGAGKITTEKVSVNTFYFTNIQDTYALESLNLKFLGLKNLWSVIFITRLST